MATTCYICNSTLRESMRINTTDLKTEQCTSCHNVAKGSYQSAHVRRVIRSHKKANIYCVRCSYGVTTPSCYICGLPTCGLNNVIVEISGTERAYFSACGDSCFNKMMTNIRMERKGWCLDCEVKYPIDTRFYVNRLVDQSKVHPWLVAFHIYNKYSQERSIEEYNKN